MHTCYGPVYPHIAVVGRVFLSLACAVHVGIARLVRLRQPGYFIPTHSIPLKRVRAAARIQFHANSQMNHASSCIFFGRIKRT